MTIVDTRIQARNLIEKHKGITRATATDIAVKLTDEECTQLAGVSGDAPQVTALIKRIELRLAKEDLAQAEAAAGVQPLVDGPLPAEETPPEETPAAETTPPA